MSNFNFSSRNDIFVGNIAHGTTDDQLKEIFSEAGRVINIRQVTDRETGTPRGFAFIEFEDIASCESAIRNLNGRELNGRALGVNYSKKSNAQDLSSRQDAPGIARSSSPAPPPQIPTISKVLDSMNLREMYEIIAKMKQFVENEPEKARLMLISFPNVTEAILGMQIRLGMSTHEEAEQMKISTNVDQNIVDRSNRNNHPKPSVNGMDGDGSNKVSFQAEGFNQARPNQVMGNDVIQQVPQQINTFAQPSQVPPNTQLFQPQQNIPNVSVHQINPANGIVYQQQPQAPNFQGNQQHLGGGDNHGIPGVERGIFGNNLNHHLGPPPPDFMNQVMNMTPQMLGTLPIHKQQQIIELQNQMRHGHMPIQQTHQY